MKVVKMIGAIVLLVLALGLLLVRLGTGFLALGNWTPTTVPDTKAIKTLVNLGDGLLAAGLFSVENTGGGLALSQDNGRSWTRVASIPQANSVSSVIRIAPGQSNLMLAAFNNNDANSPGGVFYSADNGRTWETRNLGLPQPDARSLTVIPGAVPVVLVGTVNDGVYASADLGASWEARNEGLTSLDIQHIEVSPTNPNRVFAATLAGLFSSEDGARTWRELTLGTLQKPFVLSVNVDPTDEQAVWALERPVGPRTRLWYSTDAGATWQEAGRTGTPSEFHPRSLVIAPDLNGALFMGTVFDGVYFSLDKGKSWLTMNNGLPLDSRNVFIHSIVLLPGQTPQLLAGTDLNGTIYATPVTMPALNMLAARIRAL